MTSSIRFISFPKTQPPPHFVPGVLEAFRKQELQIGTHLKKTGLESNQVLRLIAKDLKQLGFDVEAGPKKAGRVDRPVHFGEMGKPTLRYQIDAYHSDWKCGLEVEAGRAWMGNAIYRDLVQAMVMVGLEHLCLAVPIRYRFKSQSKEVHSDDYSKTVSVADALYGHSRIRLPYSLTVIGY